MKIINKQDRGILAKISHIDHTKQELIAFAEGSDDSITLPLSACCKFKPVVNQEIILYSLKVLTSRTKEAKLAKLPSIKDESIQIAV